MGMLTDDMKRLVAGLRLCYAATVTPDGRPNLSPKGTLRVVDDDHLAFTDIASPVTIENLKKNPHIEINIVDPFLRRGYRFKGRAEILHEGPLFAEMAGDLWSREGRQYPANGVVRIRVEEADAVRSPAYMFNKNVDEKDVKDIWMKRYGYRPADPE
jgi:predicted pyridoxine 5'-phosphate oxidase superfamily flavin-nucleotide-binding protein